MKIRILSLGCRLNQAEIQSVATVLQDRGCKIVKDDSANAWIVNTCVVTLRSERKTRKFINQAVRDVAGKSPGVVIVAGCFVQELKHEGNIWYVPNDYKYLIPDMITQPGTLELNALYKSGRFEFPPALRSLRTRINLKIQDGCSNFCSYCIIPYVRGGPLSRPVDDILCEFRALLDAGYKEFLLSGVMIGNYDDSGVDLAGLIKRLLQERGEYRIHLSSLSPAAVTDELIDLMRSGSMVRHLHLSLQSGSNAILERMNRHYTRERYLEIVRNLRSIEPLFNLTTDVIVGFPGETGKDFQASLDLVSEANFSHVHTFRYSRRPGTAAAELEETVDETEKGRRSDRIISLYREQKKNYYSLFHGKTARFLSEKTYSGETRGFTDYYVPVHLSPPVPAGRFFQIDTLYDEEKVLLQGRIKLL